MDLELAMSQAALEFLKAAWTWTPLVWFWSHSSSKGGVKFGCARRTRCGELDVLCATMAYMDAIVESMEM